MAFLPQGSSAQVAITAGQSIAVGAVRGGTANVTFPVGYPKGPSSTVNNGTATYGPFATATTVTVYASQGTAEYVTGTSPVCTDGPVALATDPLTGEVAGLVSPEGGTTPLMGLLSFTADDTGTAWASCPKLLDLTATLASGGTTTVLLEVRNTAGAVSTAATITADTVSQTLRQTFTSRGNQDFRVRRSSGTGSVTITL